MEQPWIVLMRTDGNDEVVLNQPKLEYLEKIYYNKQDRNIEVQDRPALQATLPNQLGQSEVHPHLRQASKTYEMAIAQVVAYCAGDRFASKTIKGSEDIMLPSVNIAASKHQRLSFSKTADGNSIFMFDVVYADGSPRDYTGFALVRDKLGDAFLIPEERGEEAEIGSKKYEQQLNSANYLLKNYYGLLEIQKLQTADNTNVAIDAVPALIKQHLGQVRKQARHDFIKQTCESFIKGADKALIILDRTMSALVGK